MKHLALSAALLPLLLATPALAQGDIRPAGNTAPVQAQLADATPLPADTPWPGGAIALDIDATDTERGVYRVTEYVRRSNQNDVVKKPAMWLTNGY